MEMQITVLNESISLENHNLEVAINENRKFDEKHFKCAKCKTFYKYFCTNCNMVSTICLYPTQLSARNLINVVSISNDLTIIAAHEFEVNTRFGPCMGHKRIDGENQQHTWKMYFKGRSNDLSECNWLYLVKPVTDIHAANLVAYQSHGELFFVTIKKIYEGQEFGLYLPYSTTDCIELDQFSLFTPEVINYDKDIWCNSCGIAFTSKNYLVMHTAHYHSSDDCDPEFLLCDHCHGNFMTYNFEKHNNADCLKPNPTTKVRSRVVPVKEQPIKYVCNGCKQNYQNLAYFYKHKNRCLKLEENKSKKFVCEVCQFRFSLKKDLDFHIAGQHPDYEKLKCNYCSFRADTVPNLDYHKKAEHRQLYLQDKNAKQKTSEVQNLTEGPGLLDDLSEFITINEKQKPPKNEYYCEQCGEKFSARLDMIIHQQAQHFRRVRGCFKCGSFIPAGTIFNHIKLVHDADMEKIYKCGICDYASGNIENIRKHFKNHERDSSVTFISCKVVYMSTDEPIKNPKKRPGAPNTNKKIVVSSGKKAYQCKNCSAFYPNLKTLLYHVKEYPVTPGAK